MEKTAHTLRIASYNIEWFNALIDEEHQPDRSDEWSARYNVTKRQQLDAIADVLTRVDADIFAIIEAPNESSKNKRSCVQALENFALHYGLRQSKAMIGFPSETHQEIAILFDPERLSAFHSPHGRLLEPERLQGKHGQIASCKYASGEWSAPRFDGAFPMDLEGDGSVEAHYFSKPPLEAALNDRYSGKAIQLIAVHAKSKSTAKAETDLDRKKLGILNRRKQLAQCEWLRLRAEQHMKESENFIILGDFNDGPGLDEYEQYFGKSGIEVVMGANGSPDKRLLNPYSKPGLKGMAPVTARFYNKQREAYESALLDFILVSPSLAKQADTEWKIWHPFNTPECYKCEETRQALLAASDHFPVSLDITF